MAEKEQLSQKEAKSDSPVLKEGQNTVRDEDEDETDHDEEEGHHDDDDGHHDDDDGHHDDDDGHHDDDDGHHDDDDGHHEDDHDHAHENEGMEFEINGRDVHSPGMAEIMERYDRNGDDVLAYDEWEPFFNDVMEAAGGEDDHSGHDHRSIQQPAIEVMARISKREKQEQEKRAETRQDHDHDHDHEHGECMDAFEMFFEFDIDSDNMLDTVEVLLACPDMLVQILNGCAAEEDDGDCDKLSTGDAWLYGMMSTLGISLISVIGVILMPVHNKKVKEYLINALIAFAVGALFGDVILHVIPHALGLHAHGGVKDDVGGGRVSRELWLGLTICAGFLLFTCIDLAIRAVKAKFGASDEDVERMMAEIEAEKANGNIQEDADKPAKKPSMMRTLTGYDEKKNRYRDIKTVGYLNLVSDGVHNFIDGVTIGVAWVDSFELGLSTTIAIIAHEIPQELGDFGILIHAGFTKWQAILWNLSSASLAMVGAIVGLAVATSAEKAIPWLLAVAAGNFLYISLVSMMPEALKGIRDILSGFLCLLMISLGFAILFVIAVFEETDC